MTSKVTDHNPTVHDLKRPWAQMYEEQVKYIIELVNRGAAFPNTLEEGVGDSFEFQEYIRSLIGFTIEEIYEAFEVLENILDSLSKNRADIQMIREYNEEASDVLSFFGNLFFHLDIDEHFIADTYAHVAKEDKLFLPDNLTDPLLMGFHLAEERFNQEIDNVEIAFMQSFQIPINQSAHAEVGGHVIGPTLMQEYQRGIFYTVQQLNCARHNMKLKPWTVIAKETKWPEVKRGIALAFLNFCYCLVTVKHRPTMVAKTFLAKNIIKFERLEEK